MPYDSGNPGSAADALAAPAKGGDMEHGEDGHESGNLFLSQDMLPPGMAAKLNPGDILEFKVIGQDADGDWEVSYNHGDDKGKGKEDDTWEQDFMKDMSPRKDTEGAM